MGGRWDEADDADEEDEDAEGDGDAGGGGPDMPPPPPPSCLFRLRRELAAEALTSPGMGAKPPLLSFGLLSVMAAKVRFEWHPSRK